MTSSQLVTHDGHDANGTSRYGDRSNNVTDWSMAITVKRYETERRQPPQLPASNKSLGGRPASDEFILRAVSAKSSRQTSVLAASTRSRPKVNSTAADTTHASRNRVQQQVTSSLNNANDLGQTSLVIKPAINQNGELHRRKDSSSNKNIDKKAKRPTRHRGGTSREQSIDQSEAGVNETNTSLTSQAKTLDIFLPLTKVTENDNWTAVTRVTLIIFKVYVNIYDWLIRTTA